MKAKESAATELKEGKPREGERSILQRPSGSTFNYTRIRFIWRLFIVGRKGQEQVYRVWRNARGAEIGVQDGAGDGRIGAAQPGAPTVSAGVVFGGSLDGHLRTYDSKSGGIILDIDTLHEFKTVNGIKARGVVYALDPTDNRSAPATRAASFMSEFLTSLAPAHHHRDSRRWSRGQDRPRN